MHFDKKTISVAVACVLGTVVVCSVPLLVENLDATDVMIIQHPMGDLTVHTSQGPKFQGFGKVTKYPRQEQYSFCSYIENNVEVMCKDADTGAKS